MTAERRRRDPARRGARAARRRSGGRCPRCRSPTAAAPICWRSIAAARSRLVEIKASRADFLADRKWQDYLDYCDRFYFAVAAGFPLDLLPPGEGLILADRFAGEILREARFRCLAAARRKAMLIRFARASAGRLQALLDPPL